MPPEHVFQDGLGVDQRADHDGDVRLLRDFERAVAEREQVFFGAVRAALGEDGDGAFVLFQKLNGLEDGLERFTVVFAVEREAEHLTHDLRDDEDGKALFFCEERQIRPRHGIVIDEWVEGESVVGDQHEAALARHLLQPCHMDAHAAEEQREAAELVEHEAEIRARLFHHLLRVDKQRGHEEHQQKQQHQPDHHPCRQQRELPQAGKG